MPQAIPHILNAGLGQLSMQQQKQKEEQQKNLLMELLRQEVVNQAKPAVAPTITPTVNPMNITQGKPVFGVDMQPGQPAQQATYKDPSKAAIAIRLFSHPLAKSSKMSELQDLLKTAYGIVPDNEDNFTLSPGQKRFDASGKEVAGVPDRERGTTQTASQKRLQAYVDMTSNPAWATLPPEERRKREIALGVIDTGQGFKMIEDYDPATGEKIFRQVNMAAMPAEGVRVKTPPTKTMQEFTAWKGMSPQEQALFKDYKRVGQDANYDYFNKKEAGGRITRMAVNKSNPSDVREVGSWQEPEKEDGNMTENDIREMYAKYNLARLKAPSDPIRTMINDNLRAKGINVSDEMPFLTYEQFKKEILGDLSMATEPNNAQKPAKKKYAIIKE